MLPALTLLVWLIATTAASSPPKNPTTKRQCYVDGAWGDVCRYENICFRGSPNKVLFISDDASQFKHRAGPVNKIVATTKLFRHIIGMPNANRSVPLHYKLNEAPEVMSVAAFAAGKAGDIGSGVCT